MYKHSDFILTPITSILSEVSAANAAVGNGIETYPLSEYIMQSVFLKMTGFQEQKMKCIVWELATNDYTYRYKRFSQDQLGECSTYGEKKKVYFDLVQAIKIYNPNYNVSDELDRRSIRRGVIAEMKAIFLVSNLSSWNESLAIEFFNNHGDIIKDSYFALSENLLENVLQERYELLYRHRNRCAHNTLSYQENVPTLMEILDKTYQHDNYIMRFVLLALIDKVCIELYNTYRRLVASH
jgi:hypothetical protein